MLNANGTDHSLKINSEMDTYTDSNFFNHEEHEEHEGGKTNIRIYSILHHFSMCI